MLSDKKGEVIAVGDDVIAFVGELSDRALEASMHRGEDLAVCRVLGPGTADGIVSLERMDGTCLELPSRAIIKIDRRA